MTAPLLVLGIGNRLLSDDGAGLALLERLQRRFDQDDVEFVDGGTLGLALLGYLEGRRAALILDAVSLGAPPGTVHEQKAEDLLKANPANVPTAHGTGAAALLASAHLTGDLPPLVWVMGIEPGNTRTGTEMSEPVARALPAAEARAAMLIEMLRSAVAG